MDNAIAHGLSRLNLINGQAAMAPITVEIVELVAEERGVSETELPPLAHAINTDALERLFDPNAASGVVTFDYAGVTVQVDESGAVNVYSDV